MRAPFLIVEGPLRARVPLARDQQRHLRDVLRRGDGDPLVVADGAGSSAPAVLAGEHARLAGAVREHGARSPSVRVLQAVPKGRGMDEVVRRVTEAGVDRVTPVRTERTIIRPREELVLRLRAVARSASEQARRDRLPRIDEPCGLADAPEDGERLVVLEPDADAGIAGLATALAGSARIGLVVGPEGGLTVDELAWLEGLGADLVHLGPSVLRSEHAALAAVAAVSALVGRYE